MTVIQTQNASGQFSPAAFRTRLVLGVLLLNLLVMFLTGMTVRQSHHQYQERAEITTRNLAQLLENEIATILRDQDIALLTVLDEYRRQHQSGTIDAAALNAFIERTRARLPEINALRITDAQGVLVYGSGVNPASRTSLADRPHFTRLRDDPQAELLISHPQISRVNQKWVVALARRVTLQDGVFGGMMFTAVALEHFSRSFAALDVGRHGSITLRKTGELEVLVRNRELSGNARPVGQKGASDTLKSLLKAGKRSGTYLARSGLDGIERTFSYRHIGDYPLLVIVGLSTEDYLAEWRRNAAMNGALALLFALMSALAAGLIHRAWRHQHQALGALARQEAQLRSSEARLLEAQRIAQIGSWELDLGTGRLIWSDEIFRIFEIDPEHFEASYEAFLNAIHPEDRDAVNKVYSEALANRAPYEITHRLLMDDGRVKWVNERAETRYDESGQPLHPTGTVQDITARMLAEERLRELNETLELRVKSEVAKNRDKDLLLIQQSRLATMGEMLHNVAHQWRQPLNALGLLQANIKDAYEYGELTPQVMHAFIADGRRYIQKMSTTIDDFRSFFQTSEEITRFSMVEAVRDALSIMEATFKDEKIAVAVETPVDVFVEGLFNELSHVLLNVLANARDVIKARKITDGLIIIWLGHEDGMGVVHLRDNGGGVPDETLKKIFDPYFTTKPSGSGIGLYMARMVLHHMNGRIEARNTAEGLEILVFVPSVAAADEEISGKA
jgi:PAS domain S-box-containing protein